MPLNKDVLGAARYAVANVFDNKTPDELIATYGSIENARLEFLKKDSEAIINHFKATTLNVPGTGLTSPSGAVTGTSTTGTIV